MTGRGPWFLTASGRQFFLADPRPEDVCIEDIAHALSNICRFGGHCRIFYSVAQHAVLVSRLVAPKHAYLGLHHDDAEAYTGDMIRPLKKLLRDFRHVERAIEIAVGTALGVPLFVVTSTAAAWGDVKRADMIALATERRDIGAGDRFRPELVQDDERGFEPADFVIEALTPEAARVQYLQRHYELVAQRIDDWRDSEDRAFDEKETP